MERCNPPGCAEPFHVSSRKHECRRKTNMELKYEKLQVYIETVQARIDFTLW